MSDGAGWEETLFIGTWRVLLKMVRVFQLETDHGDKCVYCLCVCVGGGRWGMGLLDFEYARSIYLKQSNSNLR